MSGLAFSGLMTPSIAYAFLIFYLLLSIEIYLATYTMGTFPLSFWSFGPTELRILLVVGTLVAVWQPYALIAGRTFLLFDVGFAIGTLGLAVATLTYAVVQRLHASALQAGNQVTLLVEVRPASLCDSSDIYCSSPAQLRCGASPVF